LKHWPHLFGTSRRTPSQNVLKLCERCRPAPSRIVSSRSIRRLLSWAMGLTGLDGVASSGVPAASRRKTYHHGDLRNALVATALELLTQASPDALTLREVARRVGVNHRAVYRHFADKTALFAAVADSGYRVLVERLEEAVGSAPNAKPERKLLALALAYITFAIDFPAHYRIMFGRRLNEEGRFPELETHVEAARALIATELARGIRAGTLANWPIREAVFSFWSLAHGFVSLTLAHRIKVKRPLLEAYASEIIAPLLAGFRSR
jgi:AcrR family transcriptional regulator